MDDSSIELSDPVQSALDYLQDNLGYKCGKILGKGTYGSVVLVRKDKLQFAAKIVERRVLNEMEIKIWPKLMHENVLKLIDAVTDLEGVIIFFTDLMKTNLFLRLQDHDFREDPKAVERCRIYARQVFSGISYLHHYQICHLDLRAENIFLSFNDDRAVVADFSGMSWSDMEKRFCPLPHSLRPPEMLTSKKRVPPVPIDLWSCGLLLANMYLGKGFYVCTVKHKNAGQLEAVKQYSGLFQSDVYIKKFMLETYPLSTVPGKAVKDFISIIRGFLKMNPKQRLSAGQALNHPFLVKDLLNRTVNETANFLNIGLATTSQGRIDESNLKTAGTSEEFEVTICRSDSKIATNLNDKTEYKNGKPSRWSKYKIRFTQLRKLPIKPVPLLRFKYLKNERKVKDKKTTNIIED